LLAVAPFRRYVRRVSTVQVKNVPEDVHRILRQRAAGEGRSLQEYLLLRLIEEARLPTLEEVLRDAGGRAGGRLSLSDAVAAVRDERDGP
jgi:plasmid stability protein